MYNVVTSPLVVKQIRIFCSNWNPNVLINKDYPLYWLQKCRREKRGRPYYEEGKISKKTTGKTMTGLWDLYH